MEVKQESGEHAGAQQLRGWSGPAGLRVMVVDDDPLCLKVVEQMLRRCTYDVHTCTNAASALQLLREQRHGFDLVLSDVYMPDMDGFKLLETVGLELDLPVIMMSSNGEHSAVLRGVTHGACDFLIKPVRIEELRNIWQHVIRRHRSWVADGDKEDAGGDAVMAEAEAASRKRKDKEARDGSCSGGEREEDGGSAKKPRVVWSVEMHQQFVAAVNQLGVDKAVPKKILELMNVEGLTRENVASHLQKYRLYLRRVQAVELEGGATSDAPGAGGMPGVGSARPSVMRSSIAAAAAAAAAEEQQHQQQGAAAAAAAAAAGMMGAPPGVGMAGPISPGMGPMALMGLGSLGMPGSMGMPGIAPMGVPGGMAPGMAAGLGPMGALALAPPGMGGAALPPPMALPGMPPLPGAPPGLAPPPLPGGGGDASQMFSLMAGMALYQQAQAAAMHQAAAQQHAAAAAAAAAAARRGGGAASNGSGGGALCGGAAARGAAAPPAVAAAVAAAGGGGGGGGDDFASVFDDDAFSPGGCGGAPAGGGGGGGEGAANGVDEFLDYFLNP
ncbi:MAG: hypothetical protein J3K34DRAFT_456883 [Monoraphidium minutum]|nr:MAG: hypothetical protein J3K34DRAFT_456883 [Monoraphidium minutum]